jgi:hypothetical protein
MIFDILISRRNSSEIPNQFSSPALNTGQGALGRASPDQQRQRHEDGTVMTSHEVEYTGKQENEEEDENGNGNKY